MEKYTLFDGKESLCIYGIPYPVYKIIKKDEYFYLPNYLYL